MTSTAIVEEGNGRRVCSRCVMDTSDPNIFFDDNGVCDHCRRRDDALRRPPAFNTREELRARIAAAGRAHVW